MSVIQFKSFRTISVKGSLSNSKIFFSNLQYESEEMTIIVYLNQTRVLIDDVNEPECGKWTT